MAKFVSRNEYDTSGMFNGHNLCGFCPNIWGALMDTTPVVTGFNMTTFSFTRFDMKYYRMCIKV